MLNSLIMDSVGMLTKLEAASVSLMASRSAVMRLDAAAVKLFDSLIAPLVTALIVAAAGVTIFFCPPAAAAVAGVLPSVLGATSAGVAAAAGGAAVLAAGTAAVLTTAMFHASSESGELGALKAKIDELLEGMKHAQAEALDTRGTVEGTSAWIRKTDADKDRLAAKVNAGALTLEKIRDLWGPAAALDVERRVVML